MNMKAEAELTPREKKRALRTMEIVAAAEAVFLEKGYERASVSEVAARVGVVEGNVFRYFPTKRDLLNSVLRSLYEPLIADVEHGFSRIADLHGRVRFIVWRHIRVYTETPGLARLVLHEIRTAPDYRTSALYDLQLRYTDFLRKTLEQAVMDGELKAPVNFPHARAMLYGGLEHLMWPVLSGDRVVEVDRVADEYTTAYLHGVGAPSSSVEQRLDRIERLLAARGANT